MTTRLFAVLLACLVALPGIAEAGPGRARLSTDLQDEVRKGNRRTVEVIVDGNDATISRLLGRHPLRAEAPASPRGGAGSARGSARVAGRGSRRGGDVGQRRGHLAHGDWRPRRPAPTPRGRAW